MNNKKFCITLALLAVAVAAQAAPVTVDFAVTSTSDSPNYPAGINGSGWFSFDDGLVPAGGTGVLSDRVAGLPTLDLSFSWFDTTFTEANAKIGRLNFSGGTLTDWLIGGSYVHPFCGAQTYDCIIGATSGTADFWATIAPANAAALNDGVHGGFGFGSVTSWSVRPAAAVPEPSTLTLLAFGIAGLAWARPRRPTR